MSSTQVDIVNQALLLLKTTPITSIDEAVTKAERAKVIYGPTLEEVLREHNWGFATMIETLAQISGEVASGGGWDYLYAYPSKCVRIRNIYSETASTHPVGVEYREMLSPTTQSKSIATSISPAYCEYTYLVEDPSKYDATFVKAMALNLAAKLAPAITGNESLSAGLFNQFIVAVSEAKRQDANERKVDRTTDRVSSYITARA